MLGVLAIPAIIKNPTPPLPQLPRPTDRRPLCADRSAFTAYRRDEEPDGLPCFPAAPFNPVRALTLGIAASIGRADSGAGAGPAACPPQTLADGRLRIGTGTPLLARRYRHVHSDTGLVRLTRQRRLLCPELLRQRLGKTRRGLLRVWRSEQSAEHATGRALMVAATCWLAHYLEHAGRVGH